MTREKIYGEKLLSKAEITAAIKVIEQFVNSGVINLEDNIWLLLRELNKKLVDTICQEGIQTKSLAMAKSELQSQKPEKIIYKLGSTTSGKNQAILDKEIHIKLKEYLKNLLKNIYNIKKIETKELENYCKLLQITVPKSRLSHFLLTDTDSLDADLFQEICATLKIDIKKEN